MDEQPKAFSTFPEVPRHLARHHRETIERAFERDFLERCVRGAEMRDERERECERDEGGKC